MGVDRFEDDGEDPGQETDTGLGHDAGSTGDRSRSRDAGYSRDVPQSGDARRPGDPPPDDSPRDSPGTETKRAEPRTRNEYADHARPRGGPPIEGDPPQYGAEDQSDPDDEQREAMPPAQGQAESSHSAEEPAEQHGEVHWDVEHSLIPDDSGRNTEQPSTPGNLGDEPAAPEERNYNPTDTEPSEWPAEAVDSSNPIADESPVDEQRGNDVLDRLRKAHAADLATDHANTTDPDNKQWTAERNRIHGEIINDILNDASTVPCEHRAIIAGGLPGAGKTTVLTEQAGIDLSKYLIINPDKIKEILADRELIPEVEGLSPMEASDLAHEESSVIAKHLARRAQAMGKNVIWDITMSRLESTQERIDSLRASGYRQIDAIFVDIPIEVSIKRTQARHQEGQEGWRAGHGMGGRLVPPEVIRKQADPEWGSKNKKNFENIKQSVNNWTVLDNGVDGRRAIIVDSSHFDKRNTREKRSE